MHDPNRAKDVFTRRAFEHIALRPGHDGADNALVFVVGSQDDHPCGGIGGANLFQRRHAIQLRHFQVEQNHVGPQAA